jgi:NAD(P)-dependent dehydrogenase (short-subunit alcohol dehydrogenase family)
MTMGRVEGKVAIVTGGALGIGKACAQVLAREGAKVVITDIKEAEGRALAEEITAAGGQARFVRQDVAQEAEWQAVIAATLEAFGRLDILVNNAGIGTSVNIEEETLAGWRHLMSINLDAVFLGTQYAIKAMKGHGGGSIVNISSIEGIIGDPSIAAYNASKGGVRLLTKSAALYCAKGGLGIRVNSVHPGYIHTPLIENALAASPDGQAMYDYLVSLHPIGHLGEPEDIAYGVLYLASDESKFVTGSELVIDGGYPAQ